jgi:hypothetical protein
VIVATGTEYHDGPIFQVADPAGEMVVAANARVMDSVALLDSRQNDLGKHAIVLDDIGHYEAIGCCEELLGRGLDVTYVSRHVGFAPLIEITMRTQSALKRLQSLGNFTVVSQALVLSVDGETARIRSIQGGPVREIPADILIRVDYRKPASALWFDLEGKIDHLHLVGDAKAPRDIQAAIREGHLAARSLS